MSDPLARHAEHAIACGSTSFAAAARLFDRETRRSVVMLYAWCRHCDDAVDGQAFGHGQTEQDTAMALQRVEHLTHQTMQALAGHACALSPPFAALAEVVHRHRIPHRLPLEHLSGYRMDASQRNYPTLEHTLDYCYRVAGVVGVMMAMIMGRRDETTLDHATHLGIAFQLTNMARDVLDDHASGRVYLPAEWLAHEGLTAAMLSDIRYRTAVARVAGRLIDAAEPYYLSARAGLGRLPWRCAWAVSTAQGLYREIGQEVKARGDGAWDDRVSTARHRKLVHLVHGGLTAVLSQRTGEDRAALQANQGPLWTRPPA